MQPFNDIFDIVTGYRPYYLYILIILGLGLIFYILYRIFYKRQKPEKKIPVSVILREKFATLESLRSEKKDFSVFASMLIKELVSYKIGIDLRPLTSKEIEDLFLGLEELKIEQTILQEQTLVKAEKNLEQKSKVESDSLVDLDYFNTKLFNKDKIINTLLELDRIKYKKNYEDKELKEVLFYIKDLLNDIVEDLLKKKEIAVVIKRSKILQNKVVGRD